MVLPWIPMGAWAFGDVESRNHGGVPILLFADSVLPWNRPASWDDPPPAGQRPTWWNPPTMTVPPGIYDRGEYQTWERNMQENDGAGAPNFPASRSLKAVLPTLRGLHDSPTAPYRTVGEGGLDWRWPYGNTDVLSGRPTATELMSFYILNYLDADTLLIAQIPERDIMNLLLVSQQVDVKTDARIPFI